MPRVSNLLKVAKEIGIQRRAVLRGTWVTRYPDQTGEACLVIRRTGKMVPIEERQAPVSLSRSARDYVKRALIELHPGFPATNGVEGWNDGIYGGERGEDLKAQGVGEVVEVLERAEKLALMDWENGG